MAKVYITDYIEIADIEKSILGDKLSLEPNRDIEVLMVWHKNINKHYIEKFPNLKGIVRYGVGYDNIDIKYANSKNIFVCNTPDYGTDEVSDTAIAMILNISRGITRHDYLCRNYINNWQENILPETKRTSKYKLGVIGAGRIGGSVLLKAKALRLQTCFFDPYKPRGYEKMLHAERVESISKLLNWADIVSIHTPLTEETNEMINDEFISQMKYQSSLVNTARGKILKDIDCLYEPLKNNQLSSVALDVLPNEPPKESKLVNAWRNRETWLNGRLIINPHNAYYSRQAYSEMRTKAAENALRICNGQEPFNILN
jgi:C-terminal binding protein